MCYVFMFADKASGRVFVLMECRLASLYKKPADYEVLEK